VGMGHKSIEMRIRDAALMRAGLSPAIFDASRTPGNVEARGKVWALMRACRSRDCAQLSWPQIGKACGYRNHTTVLMAVERCGEAPAWDLEAFERG
jgi:hypothetical protein